VLLVLFAAAGDTDHPAAAPSQQAAPPHYNYRFGENPFLPSQALSATGGFIPAERFPKAEWCAHCHQDVHQQWRESAHANSFREPFYIKNVNILIDTKGIEYTRHCEGCHNPIALFSGALTKGSTVDRGFDNDGITCMVCHSIQKIQNTSGTGSYVMGVPAVMVNEDGTPVTRPVDYDDILARPDLHKRAVMKDFYRSPEFCGACHKAAVPRMLNDYKWQRAFSVYDEWQQSSWSRQNPLPFYKKDSVSTCQTCHMKQVAVKDFSWPRPTAASHRWTGANTAIPTFYNYPDQVREVTKFLEDENLGIDLFALQKTGADAAFIAPLGRQPFQLAAGDDVTLMFVIQNKKIGHSLVPEQRDFYESWVQFRATDAAGRVLYDSGFLKPDGTLDEHAHSYTNRLVSKEGALLDHHQVWATRAKAYDNTILPGRSNLVRYRFRIPADAAGPISISTKVLYRRFRADWTDFVLGKHVEYPIAQMAAKVLKLVLGENPAVTGGPEPWMRWNNYGISLLDQQQYRDAEDAFRHVVELRPDYADGWTNIAIADLAYQNYDGATAALERALRLTPGDLRATFFSAMVDQAAGRLDAAATKLLNVSAGYPRLLIAHQTLGAIYYQQGKLALAREQYEACQTVDPDDLGAHYNLARIYRRLGMKQKAAQQAAFFADRKDDPGAAPFAETWLRAHPEVADETIPNHVHLSPNATPQTAQAPPANSETNPKK
jgi:tetratricopeptide (TPR) repeat protein